MNINPGTEPIHEASEKNAINNMQHYITDHQESSLEFVRVPKLDYSQGRFAFLLYKKDATRYHEIQMPGLPLHKVRYVNEEEQNIWNFPRLYVDGKSWVWKFGILDNKSDWIEPESD